MWLLFENVVIFSREKYFWFKKNDKKEASCTCTCTVATCACAEIFHAANANVYSLTLWDSVSQV